MQWHQQLRTAGLGEGWGQGLLTLLATSSGSFQLCPPGEASPRGPGAERRGAEAGQLPSFP